MEQVWQEYADNLEILQEDLELSKTNGHTIVSSHHGNLVGENGLHEHPGKMEKLRLRKVPVKSVQK
jgi:hypothetical protein